MEGITTEGFTGNYHGNYRPVFIFSDQEEMEGITMEITMEITSRYKSWNPSCGAEL